MSTRQTQPFRKGGSRAPSPALDAMRAGRSLGGGGNALMAAYAQMRKPKPSPDPMMLRTPTPQSRRP